MVEHKIMPHVFKVQAYLLIAINMFLMWNAVISIPVIALCFCSQ